MNSIKKTIYQIAAFLFLGTNLFYVLALTYDCSRLTNDIETGQAPNPLAIVCVVARLLNIALLIVGLVFIGIIGFSTWKLSMAFGDPKGFQGAKNTWTYAVLGGFIIIGVFAVSVIVANFVGIPGLITPGFLIDRLEAGLRDVLVGGAQIELH